MSRAPFIVALLLALVAPAARAADTVDPPAATPPPPAAPPPSAEPPPTVVEPSPVSEVPHAPAPPPPTTRPQPARPTTAAAAPPTVVAQPATRLKRERHGLALLFGMGITYGFFGGQLRYDIPVRPSLTVSPFVVAGILGVLPGPIGVATGFGARHRLVVDVGVAPLVHDELYLHDTRITERTVFGPIAGAGYEHVSDGGWIQRVTVEYAYAAWGAVKPLHAPHVVFLGGAIGWRVW